MNGFCTYCDQPRPGHQPQSSSTAWLLLMVVNAIVGICFWPLWFGLFIWVGFWFIDAIVQGSKGSTCTTCGTKLLRSRPAPANLQSGSQQHRTPDPEPAPDAGPKERGKLAQWAFPEDKPKRRRRR